VPWEKKFDTDAALTRAMQAFWARGYEATSISDLVDCMGINRGSLYATFGDKHSLFLQALRRYGAVYLDDWVAGLSQAHGPRAAIEAAFEQAIAAALDGRAASGCLLVNTALELSPHDAGVAAFVSRSLSEMEAFFRDRIEQGQVAGEVGAGVDPVDAARALLGLFVAIRVFARSRPDAALLASIGRQASALLD